MTAVGAAPNSNGSSERTIPTYPQFREGDVDVRSIFSDLCAAGAVFVPLRREGKAKVVASEKCGCDLPNAFARAGHQPGCRVVYADANVMSAESAMLLYSQSTPDRPLLGLVPASLGLFAFDVDASIEGEYPTVGDINAGSFMVRCFMGRSSDGRVTTLKGGSHLYFNASNVGGEWQSNKKLVAKLFVSGDGLPDVSGSVTARIDTRNANGYVAIYNIYPIYDAWSADAVRFPALREWDFFRPQRAAALFQPMPDGCSRHDFVRNATLRDYYEGALDGSGVWKDAWTLAFPADADRVGEVDRAWDKAPNYCEGRGIRVRAFESWRTGVSEGRASSKVARAASDALGCVLDHGADAESRVAVMLDMLPDLAYMDDRYYTLDGVIWESHDRPWEEVRGMMARRGVCRHCEYGLINAVMTDVRRAGRGVRTNRWVTFFRDGEVVCVDPSGGEGIGRLRVAKAEDRLRFRPRFDLSGPMPEGDPALVRESWKDTWHRDEDDCQWVRRMLSRALNEPQKQGWMVSAFSDAGKDTFQDSFAKGLPEDAYEEMAGADVESYAAEDLMRAAFVVLDDAQEIEPKGFGMALSRAGGGQGRVRSMHRSKSSRASESTALLFCEGMGMSYGRRFAKGGGWSNRVAHWVVGKPDGFAKDPRFKRRMESDENVRHLWLWIISGSSSEEPELMAEPSAMRADRERVWQSIKSGDPVLDEDERVVPLEGEPPHVSSVSEMTRNPAPTLPDRPPAAPTGFACDCDDPCRNDECGCDACIERS